MARIRTIKPEFFRHDGLAELGPLTRLLFVGLWTIADRAGRLKDRPRRIGVEVLPYDDCDIDAMLDELESRGHIVRYEVDGDPLIQITGWFDHQNVTRSKEPESQLPDATERTDSPAETPAVCDECATDALPVAHHSRKEGKGGGKEGEGKGRDEDHSSPTDSQIGTGPALGGSEEGSRIDEDPPPIVRGPANVTAERFVRLHAAMVAKYGELPAAQNFPAALAAIRAECRADCNGFRCQQCADAALERVAHTKHVARLAEFIGKELAT